MPLIAFLRAINVGGHTVKMDRLRKLFEEAGMREVSTFIASGNVIFEGDGDAAKLEGEIAAHLQNALGYEVGVFIRTPEELTAILTHPPFTAEEVEEAATLYICFLPSEPGAATAREVAAVSTPSHILRVHGRELYWLCRTKISESDVDERALSRALGMPMTMRNLNTVRRILAKVA